MKDEWAWQPGSREQIFSPSAWEWMQARCNMALLSSGRLISRFSFFKAGLTEFIDMHSNIRNCFRLHCIAVSRHMPC